jgi:endonuclease/exonuclease/phosphatase (EEP) superfamily protein YafD
MSDRRHFLSASVRFDGTFDVLILLALSGSWIGLLGHWHWFPDLFSHFRWQYFTLCLLAVLWSLWRKRRKIAGVSLITLGLNAWLIGSLLGQTSFSVQSTISQESVRVASLNVLTSNQRHGEVLEYLRSCDADLIFLMEVDDVWSSAMEPLIATHPHHLVHPQSDNFGIALFSRLPLQELRVVHEFQMGPDIGPYTKPSLTAHLQIGTRELHFYGIHPVPPAGRIAWYSRNNQLRAVAYQVAASKTPSLVMGDFNSTPWCEGMQSIREAGSLDFHSSSPPWQPTWRVTSVFAIPIDHTLSTSSLIITRRQIGPDVGSDHRPQLVEVHWAEP